MFRLLLPPCHERWRDGYMTPEWLPHAIDATRRRRCRQDASFDADGD